jgi:predicted nucleic-acid-binding Zn-ribbon protein
MSKKAYTCRKCGYTEGHKNVIIYIIKMMIISVKTAHNIFEKIKKTEGVL